MNWDLAGKITFIMNLDGNRDSRTECVVENEGELGFEMYKG